MRSRTRWIAEMLRADVEDFVASLISAMEKQKNKWVFQLGVFFGNVIK
jgi:hypothetical protein